MNVRLWKHASHHGFVLVLVVVELEGGDELCFREDGDLLRSSEDRAPAGQLGEGPDRNEPVNVRLWMREPDEDDTGYIFVRISLGDGNELEIYNDGHFRVSTTMTWPNSRRWTSVPLERGS